jgi:hypothetical protein
MAKLKHSPPPEPTPASASREPAARPDPRWRLRVDSRLTPFVEYLLLAGEPPADRIHGWVAGVACRATDLEAVWARHGPDLTRDAQVYGFDAAGLHGRKPSGPAFEAWAAAFLAANRY